MTKNIYLHSYFSRMLFGFFAGIFCVCSTFAQLPRAIYDDINGITLLQTDRQTVKNLLSPGSFMVSEAPNSDEFYRENYTVDIEYSSGECRDTENIGDRTFLGSDVWKVGLGKVVKIEIEPKASFLLSELGLDISKFNKERLYRGRKFYNIYFNKSFGMAISVGGDKVQSIIWFPRKQDHGFLCNNDRIRRYYSSNKWRIRRGPKLICVLMNLPPNITDILLNPTNGDAREFEVTVKAEDPENDVLTYIYKVSGGQIVGSGSKVHWDLKGEKPGTYTITTAADDGIGPRGRFISKTVIVN